MKHGLLLVLVGLLVLWAAPSLAKDAPAELLPELVPDVVPFELREGGAQGGPRRDPFGEDWIMYDDGNAQLFFPTANLYARVIFTPNVAFQLQGWRILPLNHRGSQAAFNTYVYRQDRNNNLTGNPLLTKRLNRLPDWDGQDFDNNWLDFELEENEYLQFEGGESFSIIFGVCPGGDQNQNGAGYWPLGDGASEARRSYVTRVNNLNAAVPTNHAQAWSNGQTASDILIRANGEYQNNFVDVGVLDVFNGDEDEPMTGQYLMLPGTQQQFKAQIANLGMDVDAMVVNFFVQDQDTNDVFNYDQVIENLAEGDTVVVVCDSSWSSETTGRFKVFVTLQAGDDANPDNDQGALDQIVYDPVNEVDAWLGYTDGVADNTTGGSDGLGWAAMFNHPNDEFVYELTGLRVGLAPDGEGAQDVVLLVARVDLSARQLTTIWADTVQTDGSDAAQWVEVALEDEEIAQMTYQVDEAIMVTYLNNDNLRVLVDSDPPIAGTNRHMPSSMMITFDGGQGYQGAASGDYLIEAQVRRSDRAPAGRLLDVQPDTLRFGDVQMGQDHSIEAMFICYGADSVTVTNIQIPPAARNYVRLSQNAFALASRETTYVTVTFRADNEFTLNTNLLVASNWDDHRQFFWRLMAHATVLDVKEGVKPGVPEVYNLSQNFPNPFNPTTTIDFSLPMAGEVTFAVFDVNGRQVNETLRSALSAGYHSIEFDAVDLPAGVYTYKLTSGDFSSVKKMVLMK